ncbi:MAG TPA: hypothetical protein VJR29_07700 [bacterium]|nr:hypothetical protein [bacterium]
MKLLKTRLMSIAATTILSIALAAGIASAQIPDDDGKIHGCYSTTTGRLRIIDPAITDCISSENAISWNQGGIPGYERLSISGTAPAESVSVVLRAQCPLGKKVLGGGFHGIIGQLKLQQSFPQERIDENGDLRSGWQVLVSNPGDSPEQFTAYAICAFVD